MTRAFSRRALVRTAARLAPVLVVGALLPSCSDDIAPRTQFPPLNYGYLPRLMLNVATVDVDNQAPVVPNDVASLSPVTVVQALTQMAHDRLSTVGSTGRAVFTIQEASVVDVGNGLQGKMLVRLDILTANGNPTAFAQANVSRVLAGDLPDRRGAVYDLTRQMMNDMNVEFEYQVRHALRDWLSTGAGSSSAPVQTAPLP